MKEKRSLVYCFLCAVAYVTLVCYYFMAYLCVNITQTVVEETETVPFFIKMNVSFWGLKKGDNLSTNVQFSLKYTNSSACPLAEFLAVIDETFWKFGAEALCENDTDKIDILCLVYLRQLGISRQLERGACALDSKGLVPKIVYFVTLGAYTFHMWNYIAVVAAYRHVQPVALYIVGDRHPQGVWWERVRRDVPGLRFVFREKPSSIAGRPAKFVEHLSDLVRMQLLYMNGGIYLDLDMVVLRSLEPLLGFDLTAGLMSPVEIANAFLISRRRNAFLKDWYIGFQDYEAKWTFTMEKAYNLSRQNVCQVYIVPDLYRPFWNEMPLLLNSSFYFDWTRSYAIHIWTKNGKIPSTVDSIQTDNSTISQVFRFVLYGDSRPRHADPYHRNLTELKKLL
ncbi:uncharacterized protein LOC106078100 [Biomphalaria glabrata]|uniref:Uncharacterized protein LOC106078100 n=1 Tax=Biomphalaria glabrata TaxID=6526 RepID=A0A9W2YWJ3_BIOGL|nr:uncharacterized protein LOC106078100 [Biomphalaria glabrata]